MKAIIDSRKKLRTRRQHARKLSLGQALFMAFAFILGSLPLSNIVFPASTASALSPNCDKTFDSNNNILFSGNCGSDATCSAAPTVTPADQAALGNVDTDAANGTGFEIPATQGKAGLEEAINAEGRIPSGGRVTFGQFASLGQEYRDYYITMRWGYAAWNWNGTSQTANSDYLKWMNEAPRIVHVTNPRTGKSIYAAAIEAGPAPWTGTDRSSNNTPKQGWSNPQVGTPPEYTGRVSGFPPAAFEALEIQQGAYDGSGDVLHYKWADDQTVKPGPVDGAVGGGSAGACGSGSGVSGALTEGGLTEEQAKKFMANYGKNTDGYVQSVIPNHWNMGKYCGGTGGSNCVSFSRFFAAAFTDLKQPGSSGNGVAFVTNLGGQGAETGTEPRVFSVFSWGPDPGHTGIVLGIHGDTIITGHASCSRGAAGIRGEGDGTMEGGGSGFIKVGKRNDKATWGWSKVANEFAYPENVDTAAIQKFIETGKV